MDNWRTVLFKVVVSESLINVAYELGRIFCKKKNKPLVFTANDFVIPVIEPTFPVDIVCSAVVISSHKNLQ